MDITGARALSERLAQQKHWCQALAVQIGRQPAFDPDGAALESYRGSVRTYRPQQRLEIVDGRPTMVTRSFSKRLIDGAWEEQVGLLSLRDAA